MSGDIPETGDDDEKGLRIFNTLIATEAEGSSEKTTCKNLKMD